MFWSELGDYLKNPGANNGFFFLLNKYFVDHKWEQQKEEGLGPSRSRA